ncbi:hypothetical protein U1Q18_016536 [Sarracenia purpurea var. burkii]
MEGKNPTTLEMRSPRYSSLGVAFFRFSAMHRLYIPKPNKPGQLRPITQPYPKEILVMDAISHVLNQVVERDRSISFRLVTSIISNIKVVLRH